MNSFYKKNKFLIAKGFVLCAFLQVTGALASPSSWVTISTPCYPLGQKKAILQPWSQNTGNCKTVCLAPMGGSGKSRTDGRDGQVSILSEVSEMGTKRVASNEDKILSQKKANHFVKEQWKNHPKDHHFHLLASNEMMSLAKAFKDTYLKPCGPNNKLINTASFTLSEVYSAYYRAVAAEESLLTL